MTQPPSSDRQLVRFLVVGRVQGVGFRVAASATASRLGLHGWVANRADGAVEGEASGPGAAIAVWCDWLRHGPPLARVDEVEVQQLSASELSSSDQGFRIVRGRAGPPA
jgi:acylphosphatase